MHKNYLLSVTLLLAVVTACTSQPKNPQQTTNKLAPTKGPVILSQFERAGQSSLHIDKNNVLHVVFQESPDNGKPVFIYYTSSSNNGASWSKPISLSNDGTGNGGGPPSIIEDGNGNIYAIWKRYGLKNSKYPIADVTLDGRGGYTQGTLFYKVLRGGQWGEQMQISEEIGSQYAWFPFVNKDGQVYVCWNEVSPESVKNNWFMWYYADWIRFGILTPTGVSARAQIADPNPAEQYKGGPPPRLGVINLHGYADNKGDVHFIYHRNDNKEEKIYYYDGKKHAEVYTYPLYQTGNNFMDPPRLLYDDKGIDHIVFKPSSATLESEQIWDVQPATGQKKVIAEIQKNGVRISGFQAFQAPGGKMSACIQVGGNVESTEAYGLFYHAAKGVWETKGLTSNAAKNKFLYAEITPITYLSTLTTYHSHNTSVAVGKDGKRRMTMTLAARLSSGGYSSNNPSIIYINPEQ